MHGRLSMPAQLPAMDVPHNTDWSLIEDILCQYVAYYFYQQGFQPNSGIKFHDFSMTFPEIFPFSQDTSTE